MNPIIGITANRKEGVSCVADAYSQAVVAVGGVPVIIPADCDDSGIEKLVATLDGLILSGGGDIDPSYFGEKKLPQLGTVDELRDAMEIKLARLAVARQMPVLGICRGMQVLNVAWGGDLYQDLYEQTSEKVLCHSQDAPREEGTHVVTLVEDSLLHKITGCEKQMVNSFHHQAVRKVAACFRSVAFADDGICEAIEAWPHHPTIGVQWHPENLAMSGSEFDKKLFIRLVEQANLFAEARVIHATSLMVDSHCDTPMCFFDGIDLGKCEEKVKVDFQKMKDGGIDAIFMATYIEQGGLDDASTRLATEKALDAITKIKVQIARNATKVEQANTAQQVFAIKNANKRAVVLALENGYALGKNLANIERFFDEGVRYITLCHNGDNAICDSAKGENTHGGLSDYGRQVIKEMNRLGMMVDLSHANEKSFFDAAKVSVAPLIFSHSSAHALCANPRNATDAQLRLLAEMGGVCQVCLYPPFLNGTEIATVCDAVNHIDYIANLVGIDFVGIGSDFDGGGGICGFQTSAEAMALTVEMLRRGYAHDAIAKIWGGNLMRVMEKIRISSEKKLKN